MELWQQLLIVCPLVFLGALIDAIAGGGGLVTLPTYYLAGLPPHAALGTNKFSASLGSFVSTARFVRNKSVNWRTVLPAVVCALGGSTLGARLALLVSERALHLFLMVMLPVLAVFLLMRRDKISDPGPVLSRGAAIVLSGVIGLVIGMYDGFFGPGAGTFYILGFTLLVHLPLREAMGNAKAVNFASNIAAVVALGAQNQIVYRLGAPAAVCSVLGSYVGAGLALKRGEKVFRPVLGVVLILLMIKIASDFFGML